MTLNPATRDELPARPRSALGGRQSAIEARQSHSTGRVISADGTTIGYRQLGQGPGVVLFHGSMSSGYNHLELAESLADSFTVYLPDRRGRGLSGPYRDGDDLQTEVDDLKALLDSTGARRVFGLSSGAIICLQAALTVSGIDKAAIYEPPLFTDDTVPKAVLHRFDAEMARGKVAAALITGMKATQMGPAVFRVMPRRLLEALTNRFMVSEEKKGSGEYAPMRTLAGTLHYDFKMVVQASGKLRDFGGIETEVLLLGGSTSPAFLRKALDELGNILPHAQRLELRGVGHAASWNTDRGGQPKLVADALREFFS